jgi:hypothetical protein
MIKKKKDALWNIETLSITSCKKIQEKNSFAWKCYFMAKGLAIFV